MEALIFANHENEAPPWSLVGI